MNDVTGRFIEIYDYCITERKCQNASQFAALIEISPSLLNEIRKGRTNAGITAIQNTLNKLPYISPEWLITGNGQMIKKLYDVKVSALVGIPLIPVSAFAGAGGEAVSITYNDIKERYVVPEFSDLDVDFMIRVKGSSMYPKYNSGDVIACKLIKESNFLQWNRVHVIHTTEQGALVKRLLPTDNKEIIQCVSDNPKYPPFNINTNEITNIALVLGVIRLE